MNHLEEAKKYAEELDKMEAGAVPPDFLNAVAGHISALALIAIAEQLERANDLEENMDYREYEAKWKEDK